MSDQAALSDSKTVLITGGATRIGAAICEVLHQAGFTVFLHYGNSENKAKLLQQEFNGLRDDSCFIFSQDLSHDDAVDNTVNWVSQHTNNLSLLINNASVFCPTPWGKAEPNQWQSIIKINCEVPFFLSQACLPLLEKSENPCVINMIDVHAERSLEDHPIYSASKAALKSLTQSFAKDLGASVRCNGISPGAILWPENEGEELSAGQKEMILNKVPMQKIGGVENICQTVLFLAENDYVNGQVINVDGGRTVFS